MKTSREIEDNFARFSALQHEAQANLMTNAFQAGAEVGVATAFAIVAMGTWAQSCQKKWDQADRELEEGMGA